MVIVISNISQHIFKILIIILSLSLTNYRVSLKVKNHIFEYVKILGTTIYLFGTSLLSSSYRVDGGWQLDNRCGAQDCLRRWVNSGDKNWPILLQSAQVSRLERDLKDGLLDLKPSQTKASPLVIRWSGSYYASFCHVSWSRSGRYQVPETRCSTPQAVHELGSLYCSSRCARHA